MAFVGCEYVGTYVPMSEDDYRNDHRKVIPYDAGIEPSMCKGEQDQFGGIVTKRRGEQLEVDFSNVSNFREISFEFRGADVRFFTELRNDSVIISDIRGFRILVAGNKFIFDRAI